MNTGSLFTYVACSQGGEAYDLETILTFCPEHHKTLDAQYNLSQGLDRGVLNGRRWDMWRYCEVLPVKDSRNIVSLGEGMTPMLHLDKMGEVLGVDLWIKDEGQNPGNSFKSRGQSAAISVAKESNVVEAVIIPTAGNAGCAMAQYCASAGMRAIVYMPANTPEAFQWECQIFGAELHLIDGTIADCGAKVKEILANETGILDVSTFKEPFRLEGKKTMGYEIAEQMDWAMPDVILYPTGGGTGLVGIWKGVQEMKALGWLGDNPTMPRMVAVQDEACAPVVASFKNGEKEVTPVSNPDTTIAYGLRVPGAFAGNMIMKTLYESGGTAVAIPGKMDLVPNVRAFGKYGAQVGPEAAALLSALKMLRAESWIKAGERVLILNTGGLYKYADDIPV